MTYGWSVCWCLVAHVIVQHAPSVIRGRPLLFPTARLRPEAVPRPGCLVAEKVDACQERAYDGSHQAEEGGVHHPTTGPEHRGPFELAGDCQHGR